MRDFTTRAVRAYLARPYLSAAIAGVIFVLALLSAAQLRINSNQLDTLPADSPHVIEARKITEMVGGTGFVIVTLRMQERDAGDEIFYRALELKRNSQDAEADRLMNEANKFYKELLPRNLQDAEKLKAASDELVAKLIDLDDVKYIRHKIDLDFIQNRILYYMEPADLREAFRRIGIKRDEFIERANPFFLDLGQPEYRLDLSDIRTKYSRVGKKEIVDDYYVSPDRKMMVIVIKPSFSFNDIARSQAFLKKIHHIVDETGIADRGIEVGLTGSYANYTESYVAIQKTIRPTMLYAMTGITLILFLFIRRFTLIASMLLALVYAIVLTFGLTYLLIGELNLITSLFGGILAGLGVDFGIHLIFRFREEFAEHPVIPEAMTRAILQTGPAAAYSVGTTTVAFAALMVSQFKGFSHFGIISAYGIIITAFSMFFITPLILVLFQRVYPNLLQKYVTGDRDHTMEERWERRLNVPAIARITILSVLGLSIAAGIMATNVQWDHDVRNMLDTSIPSEKLKDEMHLRYEVAGDPLAIASESLDEAKALWEFFEPLPDHMAERITQVVSPWSFVPPWNRQLQNRALIANFRRQNEVIKYGMLPDRYKPFWGQYQRLVTQQPFWIDDVPDDLLDQFRAAEESRYQGWLTFVYPDVTRLYNQRDLVALDDLVSILEFPIVGKHSLGNMAYHANAWRNYSGRPVFQNQALGPVTQEDLQLSAAEHSAIIDMANHADEAFLKNMHLTDLVVDAILKHRPFENISDMQSHTIKARTIGSTLLVAQFTRIVLEESRFIVVGTLVLVLIILWISFRNLTSSLISLAPLTAGLILMAGSLPLLDVKINYFNVAVLPIIVGYGINNGIFVYYRFLETGSVFRALYHTGSAGMASSLTSLAGWGAIAMTDHPGLSSMGVLACIGLVAMMFVTLVFLPAVLVFLNQRWPSMILRLRKAHFQHHPHTETENETAAPS
ncbi:MAG: MMPL family transporter [Leptospiraceae bacterium]|nr:MMPL family transporter [Leptospiraceae bacterium]